MKKKLKIWSTKKADIEFSKFIRERDKRCVNCGRTEYLQNSHYWPRARSSVRYCPENCDTLCYKCHYGDRQHGWEYAKQGAYLVFKKKQLGPKRYGELEKLANTLMTRTEAIKNLMAFLAK